MTKCTAMSEMGSLVSLHEQASWRGKLVANGWLIY